MKGMLVREFGVRILANFTLLVFAGMLLPIFVKNAAADVPEVDVTYHGVKTHSTFKSGDIEADAWSSGDIVFYAPQGRVSQEAARKWVSWYVHVDNLYRRQSTIDFNQHYRRDDPNFGKKKVISFGENCGAGCGNKLMAEADLGYLDAMVSDPENFVLHWIFFYEMGRGGPGEGHYGRAMWPTNTVLLPHTMGAMALHEIGGDSAVLNGDAAPKALLQDLDRWEASNNKWADVFVDRRGQVQNGWTSHDLATAMLMRIMVETDIDTVIRILKNVATKTQNPSSATGAMCDWRDAINAATGNAFDDRMVNKWGMPNACGPASSPVSLTALISESTGQCVDIGRQSTADGANAQLWNCHGGANQQFEQKSGNGGVMFVVEHSGKCLDASSGNISQWSCHGRTNQVFNWDGAQLRDNSFGQCLTIQGSNVALANCENRPDQHFSTTAAPNPPIAPISPPASNAPPANETVTTPNYSCQQISDTRGTHHNVTWGSANSEERAWWIASSCNTAPTSSVTAPTYSCQQISDTRGTHHNVTWGSANGEERAWWIANGCSTAPAANSTPTQDSATTTPASGSSRALISETTGQCVDIHGASTANAANAIMWDCHGHGNQQIEQMSSNGGVILKLAHSGKCLDAWAGNVYQWNCHSGPNQVFNWVGAQLRDNMFGQCLTIQGSNVALANCENRPEQRFRTGG